MAEFRHGHAKQNTGAWKSWRQMRARCLNLNAADYPRYGGRGVAICERWDRFQNFFADMGERPEGFTLERKDNKGNYTPDNCKWATRKEQARNRSHCRIVEYQGERKTVSEWAEIKGLEMNTLRLRLNTGWSIEDALHRPVRGNTKCQYT